jgi:hypothetical protein
MMICASCGRRTDPNRSFCTNCGSSVFVDDRDALRVLPSRPSSSSLSSSSSSALDQLRSIEQRSATAFERAAAARRATRAEARRVAPVLRLGPIVRLGILAIVLWYAVSWLSKIPEVLALKDGLQQGRLSDDDVRLAKEALRERLYVLVGGTPPPPSRQPPNAEKPPAAVAPMQRNPDTLLAVVDHLVYATPNLQAGVDRIERMLGVRAAPGGQHPGRGTRNALLSLGPSSYLEIIGPDPEQPTPREPRPFGIDDLEEPRLVTWAAKAANLEQLAADARAGGVRLGEIIPGSRRTADGRLLSWRYTDPRAVVADRIVPFFIDWGRTPHPASTSPGGAALLALRAQHPDPAGVTKALRRLGLDLPVDRGPRPALLATVTSPRGRVELR